MRPHPLRREIVATALVNGMVNRAGTTFAFRIGEETGASGADIVRAHEAARAIVGQEALWRDIEALDASLDVDVQTEMYLESRKLVERASRWLLRHRKRPLAVATTIEFFAEPVARLTATLPACARRRTGGGSKRRRSSGARRPRAACGAIAALDLLPSRARHHRARRRPPREPRPRRRDVRDHR